MISLILFRFQKTTTEDATETTSKANTKETNKSTQRNATVTEFERESGSDRTTKPTEAKKATTKISKPKGI